MAGNVTRYIIDKAVDRALREMKLRSKRELRNIVELGLFHSKGSFQSEFFSSVRQMLIDQHSPYYELAFETASNVDTHALKKFGINLGYNAWTAGARRIRESEGRAGCSIPWAIVFNLNENAAEPLTLPEINGIVSQARELGIYSFFFLCGQDSGEWSQNLLHSFSDCAFFLFMDPAHIGPETCAMFLEAGNGIPVIAYSPTDANSYEAATGLLRGSHCLYSAFIRYGESDFQPLFDSYVSASGVAMPPATFLLRGDTCTDSEATQLQAFVDGVRSQPVYATFLVDFFRDIAHVGSIISADARYLEITNNGGICACPEKDVCASIRDGSGLSSLLKFLMPRTVLA